jgi:phosphoribosylformylglycinamidine synthase subunit PurS
MIDDVSHITNMAIASHYFTASMKYQARIFVTLRPSVLDPAGTAVQSALKQMDYHVDSVRIGKYVEIILDAADEAEASQKLNETCDKLLANPVIENYRFELTVIEESKA